MTDEQLMQSTQEEQEFWLKCVSGLPGLEGFSGTGFDANGVRIPWGSGPHSLRAFREAVEIVKPKSILEIGMNLAYATVVLLELSGGDIVTIEISDKAETQEAIRVLYDRYGRRVKALIADSSTAYDKINDRKYDMIFIDGGHLEENVVADVNLGIKLGIQCFLMDDWLPRFGPGVQIAANKFGLKLIKEWGNMALLAYE